MAAPHVITLDQLREACSPGGASVLTSITRLMPAAGPFASVAPAKFTDRGRPVFAYEKRFYDGKPVNVVLIDSKQSQNNRCEAAVSAAMADGDPVLSRVPRIRLDFGDGSSFTDMDLPHRAFDGQIRAGTIDGAPATAAPEYRALRDATTHHARALLERSPMTLVFGGWDASRKSHQGRYRSLLVGEIVGVLADQDAAPEDNQSMRGGARIDPLGQRIDLTEKARQGIAEAQKEELSKATFESAAGKKGKPSVLGLGGIPPELDQLGGVTCSEIIRSHVLSFSALRSLRFDSDGPEGDVACRVVLAALALNALARSDSELLLRANCDLVEAGPTAVALDMRHGEQEELGSLGIAEAQSLLAEAIAYAEQVGGLTWDGSALVVAGNPAVLQAAGDASGAEDA